MDSQIQYACNYMKNFYVYSLIVEPLSGQDCVCKCSDSVILSVKRTSVKGRVQSKRSEVTVMDHSAVHHSTVIDVIKCLE